MQYAQNYLSTKRKSTTGYGTYKLLVSPDANRWNMVLLLCELCFSLPFSNGSVEQTLSVLKRIFLLLHYILPLPFVCGRGRAIKQSMQDIHILYMYIYIYIYIYIYNTYRLSRATCTILQDNANSVLMSTRVTTGLTQGFGTCTKICSLMAPLPPHSTFL